MFSKTIKKIINNFSRKKNVKMFMIDSNILINYVGKNMDETTEDLFYEILENYKIVSSILCLMEVYQGARDKSHREHIDRAIEQLRKLGLKILYGISEKESKLAFKIFHNFCLSHGTSNCSIIIDRLLTAQSINKNLILVTDNIGDFNYIENLKSLRLKDLRKINL